jgi:hypothetical protein
MPRPETIPLQHGQLPNISRLSARRSRVLALLCGSPSTWLQPVSRPVVRSNPRRRVTAGGAKYRIFVGEVPSVPRQCSGPSCLNRSIRGSRGESGRRARPPHRPMDHESPASTRLRRRGEAAACSSSPDDAVGKAPGAEDGVSSPGGVLQKSWKLVHRRFSCSRAPARSHRSHRRVAAGRARAEYRNFGGERPLAPSAIAKGSAV